jgi:hypothetical protein
MGDYLKKHGKIYLGFAPLWKRPYGAHISSTTKLPWAHLIFPEKIVLAQHSRLTGETLMILAESGYTPIFLRTNVSNHKVVKIFDLLRRIPFCEEYFTINAYTILEKCLVEKRLPPSGMERVCKSGLPMDQPCSLAEE